MSLEEILKIVEVIFREVIEDSTLVIKYDTNSDAIDEWDSLINIELIIAIEKEFDITFDLSQFYKFKNVGQMCEWIKTQI